MLKVGLNISNPVYLYRFFAVVHVYIVFYTIKEGLEIKKLYKMARGLTYNTYNSFYQEARGGCGFAYNINIFVVVFCHGRDVFICCSLSNIGPDETKAADNPDIPSKNCFPCLFLYFFPLRMFDELS